MVTERLPFSLREWRSGEGLLVAMQVYGTIRRVLSGGDGSPWIAEILQHMGGMVYLEMAEAPRAGVGDDILADAEVSQHRDGRAIARAVPMEESFTAAIRRLRNSARGASADGQWQVLNGLLEGEARGSVRLAMDPSSISIIRSIVSVRPAGEILSDRQKRGLDLPSPLIHSGSVRPDAMAAEAVLGGGIPSVCSYTSLALASGAGMVPRHDISTLLSAEFEAARAMARRIDVGVNDIGDTPEPLALRRAEAFADAFAVTELAMAGRSLKELDRIVSCREAAIIGQSWRRDGVRRDIGGTAGFTGAAARAALTAAAAAADKGAAVGAAEIVRQAERISERHVIGDKGLSDLRSALAGLRGSPGESDIRLWLANLSASTGDRALRENCRNLSLRLARFHLPGSMGRKDAASAITRLHASSLRLHIQHLDEQGISVDAEALGLKEADAWSARPQSAMRRLSTLVKPWSRGAQAVRANIVRNIAEHVGIAAGSRTEKGVSPATGGSSVSAGGLNPWAASVAGRLQQCAAHATEAYRINAAVAARGGTPSPEQRDAFRSAVGGLAAFAEAVVLRDPMKDSKSVRKKLEDNPEIEASLRLACIRPEDGYALPMEDDRRHVMRSVILALDAKADIPEMPQAAAEGFVPDFGFVPSGEHE
jgi:hypothetical protein